MTHSAQHLINGERRGGTGPGVSRHNPSDRRDVVTTFACATSSEVTDAVESAAQAFRRWREEPGPSRAALLFALGESISQRQEEFAQLIAREVGKPIGEARGEVGRAVVICRYYAGEAVREIGEVIPATTAATTQFTLRDPLGVVALITPWNFPLAIPIWKAAPALAFGNTVVLKPSELSTAVADLLGTALIEAGFPAGVFNIVLGDGTTGTALINEPRVAGISFTGSARVGALVQAAAAARNVRCQTEMGGKNVVIVAADADLDRAATLTAAGAFRFAGQKCTATSRVVVDHAVADRFAAALLTATEQLKVGSVTDPTTAIGPLVSSTALARVQETLAQTHLIPSHRTSLPSGEEWEHGEWLPPITYRVEDASHPLARDELFAPVLVLLESTDIDHALALANDTRYGLSASLFTRDLGRAFRYIRHIEAGLVRINGDTTGVDPHAPFGGVKGSSSGSREQGRAAREFYTEIRTIQIHT